MSEGFPHYTCTSCRLEFNSGDSTVNCPQCGAVYHRFCWKERGGCTAPGCAGKAAEPAEEPIAVTLAPRNRRIFPRVVVSLLIAAALAGLWFWQQKQHSSVDMGMMPQFVFQASFNGVSGLMTMNPGEKTPRSLLPIDVSAFAVRPSGDGLAVVHYGALELVGMDGKTAQKVSEDAADVNPVFTPDNARLIYATSQQQIVVRTLDGSAPDKTLSTRGDVTDLVLAPDGRTLAYIAGKRLYLSWLDSDKEKELARGASSPVFAPDGTALFYIAKEAKDRAPRLYRGDTLGRSKQPLTEDTRAASSPAVSVNGKSVACILGGEVAVMSPAGEGTRFLTKGSKAKELSFSSDDQAVVYTTHKGLFSVPLAGGTPEQLLDSPVAHPGVVDLKHGKRGATTSLPAIPDGYALAFTVNADFDGDGKAETAYGAAPIMPEDHGMPMSNDPPTFVLVAKDGKVIFREKDSGLTLKHLAARDLTGDGTPELLYTWESMGASDGVNSTYIFQWKDGKFRNIIGTEGGSLSHMLEGGLIFQPGKPGKPATLILYDFIWADNESHADPHRYWAEWYTLKNGKFALSKKRETKKRYYDEDPMSEFGTFTGERY
ncbi:MAG: RING finger protein [Armatimonadota bacterium]